MASSLLSPLGSAALAASTCAVLLSLSSLASPACMLVHAFWFPGSLAPRDKAASHSSCRLGAPSLGKTP